jgi:peroxiredoxin
MVPRQVRMLIDSASARLRWCLLALVCSAAAAPGCGPTSSAKHAQQQKSDLLPAPRQNNATRGWIGILVAAVAESGSGVQVMGVVPDSPAALAGMAAGDSLLSADDRRFQGPDALVALIRLSAPGSVLRFQGRRAGASRTFEVNVQAAPDENTVLARMFVGRPAPPLDGVVAIGDAATTSWEQLRGRVVVLDFWAPWCGVCHVVADDLNHWQHEFGERLQVVGISAGTVEDVSRLAPRFHMQYPVVADPSEAVSTAFSASAVPLMVVVDAKGVVRAITLGYSSARMSAMKNIVAQLVSQQ